MSQECYPTPVWLFFIFLGSLSVYRFRCVYFVCLSVYLQMTRPVFHSMCQMRMSLTILMPALSGLVSLHKKTHSQFNRPQTHGDLYWKQGIGLGCFTVYLTVVFCVYVYFLFCKCDLWFLVVNLTVDVLLYDDSSVNLEILGDFTFWVYISCCFAVCRVLFQTRPILLLKDPWATRWWTSGEWSGSMM